ncbi:MAG: KH domain-containing protein [Oscillospiraceae bacterium]|nr:KH domain-containing protein [Oscillospiraceae bacterium]
MGADLKELLTYIAVNLADYPDKVAVSETPRGDGVAYELRVASEDMGKIIGRGGRIAKSIRTILRSAAGDDAKVFVDISDA